MKKAKKQKFTEGSLQVKKAKKQKFTTAPKMGARKNAGPKMKDFTGVMRGKKAEPDAPIVQRQSMPIGKPNPGSKVAASAARMKRLSNVRI